MNRVAIDDLEPRPHDEELHADRRPLSEPLGTDHVAITRYVLESGERFSGSVHAHFDQEEVFVVLEGEATFEAYPNDDRDGKPTEITVTENEVIRFAPGEFQTGRNDGERRVVALALGAPRDTEDIRIARIPVLDDRNVSCPDCEADHMRISSSDEAEFECPNCAATLNLD
ncbi:cupin domain-containing protein [Natronorubrum sp. DTA28]|uniref:cupin domain-containing protein n=1 Tax=Natronorubrum sp. DTA28 TaxID=3447019 RepID=UPI003F87E569